MSDARQVRRRTGGYTSPRLIPAAYSRGGFVPLAPAGLLTQPGGSMEKHAQGSAAPAEQSLKYRDMSPRQKAVFVLKLVVLILSFGFIYPNLMSD
jgi:hypothetical protein